MKPTLNTINKVIEVTGKSYLEVLPVVEASYSIVEAITTLNGDITPKDINSDFGYNRMNIYNMCSLKKGMIVAVKGNFMSGFPEGFITKILFVETLAKFPYIDVFDPFKNIYKSVCFNGSPKVILHDYLPRTDIPYYMYLNKACRFEYFGGIRFATEEEKKEYRKIINRLKRYGD